VTDGSPADHAGLQQGDVITGFNGKPIKTTRDLAVAVADTASGKSATMTVWRNDHSRSLDVTIGTQATHMASAAAGNGGAKPVGMALEALTPDARNQLNIAPEVGGVLVGQVTPGSNADQSGVRAGDVIQQVAGNPVSTPSQVADAIHTAEHQKKQAISLLVMRGGVTSYLGLQLA
jgi:serine protease Do